MKKNVGKIDRTIRLIVLVLAVILYFTGKVTGTTGTVILIVGIVLGTTGLIGFCPLYTLLGINTCPLKK